MHGTTVLGRSSLPTCCEEKAFSPPPTSSYHPAAAPREPRFPRAPAPLRTQGTGLRQRSAAGTRHLAGRAALRGAPCSQRGSHPRDRPAAAAPRPQRARSLPLPAARHEAGAPAACTGGAGRGSPRDPTGNGVVAALPSTRARCSPPSFPSFLPPLLPLPLCRRPQLPPLRTRGADPRRGGQEARHHSGTAWPGSARTATRAARPAGRRPPGPYLSAPQRPCGTR